MTDRNDLTPAQKNSEAGTNAALEPGAENPTEDSVENAQEAAGRLRRRIIKAGVVAVPTIISLQSGTAWALSSCASRGRILPSQADLINGTGTGTPSIPGGFIGFGQRGGVGVTSDQEDVRTALISRTSGQITDAQIDAIIGSAGAGGGSYPETGSVNDEDVIFLAAANPSCWTSFCAGPIANGAVGYTPSGGNGCGPPPPP